VPETMIGDHKVYYESHGQGEPLIMIRGLGATPIIGMRKYPTYRSIIVS
jgi:hypothetical protein